MAFGTNGRTTGSLAEINIVPLVDVVLVLLIIFMVTAPLMQSGIEVDLPQTRMVKTITEERVTITIDRAERLYVGSEKMNINDLGPHLRSLLRDPERQEVFLRADKDVRFGTVAQVMDRLRLHGITKINLVTRPYIPESQ
jgi:biopolymer transport protein ExbD/biopolymer transport protein TolR